tara:strand:+ start:333 stop:668 length:336 start_codon:yes stop_codon:yes gene_type:complete
MAIGDVANSKVQVINPGVYEFVFKFACEIPHNDDLKIQIFGTTANSIEYLFDAPHNTSVETGSITFFDNVSAADIVAGNDTIQVKAKTSSGTSAAVWDYSQIIAKRLGVAF